MPPIPPPVLLLAPLCRDEIVEPGIPAATRPGGAGYYASWALARLGARVVLHTPLAGKDRDLLRFLPERTEVVVHPSRDTTFFRIETDPNDLNRRTLERLAASDPCDPSLLGGLADAAYLLLAPLLPEDLGRPLMEALQSAPVPIDLGVQGLVREVDSSGRIVAAGAFARAAMPRLRVLAGDEAEIMRFAGIGETAAACRSLVGGAAEEVIATRGDRGAVILDRGREEPLEIAAVPPPGDARRRVGLGDTFLAVYGWRRHGGAGIEEAGRQAAAAAARVMVRDPAAL